jgi:hypothetical protein
MVDGRINDFGKELSSSKIILRSSMMMVRDQQILAKFSKCQNSPMKLVNGRWSGSVGFDESFTRLERIVDG